MGHNQDFEFHQEVYEYNLMRSGSVYNGKNYILTGCEKLLLLNVEDSQLKDSEVDAFLVKNIGNTSHVTCTM